jgi:hypothetical protein
MEANKAHQDSVIHSAAITRRRFVHAAAGGVSTLGLTGCLKNWLKRPPELGPELAVDFTEADLLARVNDNARRLFSWRSTEVSISAGGLAGLAGKLSAMIAVESPRNFRLMVSSIAGNEADLGSNSERFWFWIRRNEPKNVFTARHDQTHRVKQRMQIPFETDWLMEVLGVIPIDENIVTLLPAPEGQPYHQLVADYLSPDGQRVRRVIDVDRTYGYIRCHSLFDANDRLIAQATLSKQQRHDTGDGAAVILPHEIHLNWPPAKLKLTLQIGQVEINPKAIPEEIWQLQPVPNYPVYDLGR